LKTFSSPGFQAVSDIALEAAAAPRP